MDKATHDAEHDSIRNPQPDCEWCSQEVYRRTHRCFGDGASTSPLPPPKDETA